MMRLIGRSAEPKDLGPLERAIREGLTLNAAPVGKDVVVDLRRVTARLWMLIIAFAAQIRGHLKETMQACGE